MGKRGLSTVPVLVLGPNPAAAALSSPRVEAVELLLKEGEPSARLNELMALARRRGVRVRRAPREQMDRLAEGAVHQGAILSLTCWPYLEEGDLDAVRAGEGDKPFLLILDHLQDVGNVGAILRSAHLCGVTGVVMPRDRAAPVSTAAVRASAGAAVFLDIYRVGNLNGAIGKLKEAGLWVYALEGGQGKSILDADLTGPLALVLGGEDQGVSRLVKENCDGLLSLPMSGRTGSFNASVAAGIAMFEVMRQRSAQRGGARGA